MGQYTPRIKGRMGKAEGLTAGDHKLARILYGMILYQRPYDEPLVQLAYDSAAHCIVTHNILHLRPARALGIEV